MIQARLPNLLVIGAMKAGTTTLCEELARQPDVWFPEGKEPDSLVRHLKGEPHALDDYASLYRNRTERILGDGSTGNAKVPFNPDVSGLAATLLGPNTKIVYITRDPIIRTTRHIAHEIGNGRLARAEGALFSAPECLAVSAYEMQLSYWRRHFPAKAILRVTLEEYQADRAGVLAKVLTHIGLNPVLMSATEGIYANRGQSRRSAYKSPLRHLLHSRPYAKLRERLPRKMRRWFAERLLPKATIADVQLTETDRIAACRALAALDALDAPTPAKISAVLASAWGDMA